MTRKKAGGREHAFGCPWYAGAGCSCGGGRESDVSGETEAVRAAETGRVAANPAAWSRESPGYFLHTACAGRIRALEAELAETQGDRDKWAIEAGKAHDFGMKQADSAEKAEARIRALIHCDIAEMKERIALMEQATCDFCGHKFYALEVDE